MNVYQSRSVSNHAIDAQTTVREDRRIQSRFYQPELDGLRFFAFFAVFLSHTLPSTETYYYARHIPHWIGESLVAIREAGSWGVELFFCLSAYLITQLL